MEAPHNPDAPPAPVDVPPGSELSPPREGELLDRLTAFRKKCFPPGGEGSVGGVSAIDAIDRAAQKTTDDTFKKLEQQPGTGTNEGGWFEKPTGERVYIKFYGNEDQARAEFMTNQGYARLGLKVVTSELVSVRGRIGVASYEIAGAKGADKEYLKASRDVRKGFVASAFFADWDVVGENYDNILKAPDGDYRYDSGGSTIFRARGGNKEFSPHDIPELRTMLDARFPAGRVFADITRKEVISQARELIDKLDVPTIDALIAEAGFTSQVADRIREGLVGRREFLVRHFGTAESGETEDSRFAGILERFDESRESLSKLGIRASAGLLCESDLIENQIITLIEARDKGSIRASFKLTPEQANLVLDLLKERKKRDGRDSIKNSNIWYDDLMGGESIKICKAFEFIHEDSTVKVSKGTRGVFSSKTPGAQGLVEIEMPYTEGITRPEELETKLNDILICFLGVREGLSGPTSESERRQIQASYRWHHKLSSTEMFSPEQLAEVSGLRRREVFPGYFAAVSEGASRRYEEKYGRFAVYHELTSDEPIASMLRLGLLSTHERFRRELGFYGTSSQDDYWIGSANKAFVRTILERSTAGDERLPRYAILMGPEIYDRTDWYGHGSDRFGLGSDSDSKSSRQSPDEVLQGQRTNGYRSNNEQMLGVGIGPETFRAVACADEPSVKEAVGQALKLSSESIANLWEEGPQAVRAALAAKQISTIQEYPIDQVLASDPRMGLIEKLHAAGIEEINGVPVEKFVVSVQRVDEFIDLAHGGAARSSNSLAIGVQV